MTPDGAVPPKVFISYERQSDGNVRRVSDLARKLARDGVASIYDEDAATPPEGWARWMQRSIADASFVLVVCTDEYRRRFDEPAGDAGLGVRFESDAMMAELYRNPGQNTRFLPVILDESGDDCVPTMLSMGTVYRLTQDDDYERLYARITGQDARPQFELGAIRPPRLPNESLYNALVLPDWDLSSKGLAGRRESRTNIPAASSSFIGRHEEFLTARQNVLTNRVVTLTAPAGTGKTRLALAVGSAMVDEFQDGVWWVDLASMSDPNEIPHTMAQLLGILQRPEQVGPASIAQALRTSRMLIIFDNCERHAQEIAWLADQLVRQCPGLHVMATSREPLGADQELAQPVRPLAIPRPDDVTATSVGASDGGALFLARAREVRPDFTLENDADARAVAAICRTCGGSPLAIELAAGALDDLSVGDISTGISAAVEVIDAAGRHQILEAVTNWRYRVLSDDAKALWEALAVFAGGFSRPDALAVCAPALPTSAAWDSVFDDLVRSLLVARALKIEGDDDDPNLNRFRLLESVRHFGRQRLVSANRMAEQKLRHADYFLELAERARPQLRQQDQRRWLRTLEADHDDIRSALHWFRSEGRAHEAMRLASAMGRFWHMRGYWQEGRRLLREVIDMPTAERGTALYARALVAKGHLAFVAGHYTESKAFYDDALEVRERLADDQDIADSLHRVGCVQEVLGDFRGAEDLQKRALELALSIDNQELLADVYHHLGVLAGINGAHQPAERLHEQSLELRRSLGDMWGAAWSLVVLGNHYRLVGNVPAATRSYRESLALYEDQGDRRRIATVRLQLADLEIELRALADGAANLRIASRLVVELGDPRGIAEALESWIIFAMATSNLKVAFRLLGASDALRDAISARRSPQAQSWIDRSLQSISTTATDRYNWVSEGQRMTAVEALEDATRELNIH